MKYMQKNTKEIIKATQWFKDGDHPLDYSKLLPNGNMSEGAIVGFYRLDDDETRICSICGHKMYDHGMLNYTKVCPGNWVITNKDGTYTVVGAKFFNKLYIKI